MAWWRRGKGETTAEPAPPAELTVEQQDVLFAETVARHFDGALVHGRTVEIARLGLTVECVVDRFIPVGGRHAASLHFLLGGPSLGERVVFASISGYGAVPEAAILEGACDWSCAFAPVLGVAFGGDEPSDAVDVFDVEMHGRRFRVVGAKLDRVLSLDGGPPADPVTARHRFEGFVSLTSAIIAADSLPLLPDGPTVLGAFLGESSAGTMPEVKVNGGDWPASAAVLRSSVTRDDLQYVLLRELAVLTPLDPPPPLTRGDLERTIAGLAELQGPGQVAAWPGWDVHRGVLAEPMSAEEVARTESLSGPLPDDYRDFLLDVASSGAGPGYGLRWPVVESGHVVLADAGCGVQWQLRLEGAERGTVWVDAAGSDQRVEQVAGSFGEWYRAWIDAGVRGDQPWVHWDATRCATPSVLSQALDAAERSTGQRPTDLQEQFGVSTITLTSGMGPGAPLIDPCQSCVVLARQFGLDATTFVPGVLRRPSLG